MGFDKISLKGRALRLLAGREHSRAELLRKLAPHAEEGDDLHALLDDLQAREFISEARVVESVLNRRAGRLGATRIRQELQSKGLGADAVQQANRNAALNGLDNIVKFETANAFDVLKQWGKEGKKWDVVMLDPPAFTKSRANIEKAITGYKEINLRGMKLVKPGGFLVTSSCTNLVNPELFLQIIDMAAKDARRKIRQVTFQTQSSDHPIIWSMENTQYLKFLIIQVG